MMYFKRDVWEDLEYWKDNLSSTLEVRGARQVGKTFILKKFCQKEFKTFIYINMVEDTGRDFLWHIKDLEELYHDKKANAFHVSELLSMYTEEFIDSENTVVLIDEIQESSRVYNLIRSFTRDLRSRFIVTGSYLGKTLDKDFFLPAGDLYSITMYSMSFLEFLDVFGTRETHKQFFDNKQESEQIKHFFELYTTIGGYPSVITRFIETNNVTACLQELDRIIDTFVSESTRYFDSIVDEDAFRTVMLNLSKISLAEKKGKNLIEDLNKIVKKPGDSRFRKESIDNIIGWLHRSSIVGYAEKFIDCDSLTSVPRARFYFQDLGIAYNFGIKSKFDIQALHGYLAETYVYHTIRNKYYQSGVNNEDHMYVIGTNPTFSTYSKNDGELDFVLFGGLGGFKNGIEVKWGDGAALTGNLMLKDSMIDNLYVLAGNCPFIDNGQKHHVPLYFADLMKYPLLKEKPFSFENLSITTNSFLDK